MASGLSAPPRNWVPFDGDEGLLYDGDVDGLVNTISTGSVFEIGYDYRLEMIGVDHFQEQGRFFGIKVNGVTIYNLMVGAGANSHGYSVCELTNPAKPSKFREIHVSFSSGIPNGNVFRSTIFECLQWADTDAYAIESAAWHIENDGVFNSGKVVLYKRATTIPERTEP